MRIKKSYTSTICLLLIGLYLSCEIDNIENIIPTEKNSDSSLIVIYNNERISYNGNNIIIPLLMSGANPNSVEFILEVGEGATLQDDNNDLLLDENNRYTTTMNFSGGASHNFKVTAQDGGISIYTVRVQLIDSKEIFSFVFLKEDNALLSNNITMDITAKNITKTVTNVERITHLIPTIAHNGSNISPSSKATQDFSTNNTYMVTAFDGTMSTYTVNLTNYYEVTINISGGLITNTPITTKYILYGDKVTPPSDPSQEHYGFKGWYDDPEGGNVFDFNTAITTQTIVYAQWTNKQYQVRFYHQGANPHDTVLETSLTAIPASDYPTPSTVKQLYKWYSDIGLTKVYDKHSLVVGNLDLYAKVLDTDGTFKSIVENEVVPFDLANYDDMSELIFSNYIAGADVIARYVTTSGNGNGSSWANASGDIQAVIDGIGAASENRVYVVLVASGTYNPDLDDGYGMKNHVAIVGGFTSGSYDRAGETYLDGNNNKRVFYNNGLDSTALLYGVIITNGYVVDVEWADRGAGMLNDSSSPTLINVIFSGNEGYHGGGMYNRISSPALINVIFSGNTASDKGGGMVNDISSFPTLINVIFSNNKASSGGGMYNLDSSSPTLNNVTFSDNEAAIGGGMYNNNSDPTLINAAFSNNTANNGEGGGIYNEYSSPATLNSVIFSGNKASSGGGMYNVTSTPILNNVTFSGNEADVGGGMYNKFSPSLLNNVTFSGNTAHDGGGGMLNYSSALTLINVTFSGNKAKDGGGGMNNWESLPVLINVVFSDNAARDAGGGIFHDGRYSITLINTILWNNDNGNIYLYNDTADTETVNLYYSVIEGGTSASTIATGIRLYNGDTNANPISIVSKEVITDNPELGPLANYGGVVNTIFIDSSSPAKDKGVYVRGVKSETGNLYPATNLYYSIDNADWYSDPGLTTQESPPNDADDLTATDARGYGRVGFPDMGAYEEGGTSP